MPAIFWTEIAVKQIFVNEYSITKYERVELQKRDSDILSCLLQSLSVSQNPINNLDRSLRSSYTHKPHAAFAFMFHLLLLLK